MSAPHIYQSALELTPLSSIVRKLHYYRRLTPFPKVEIGIPNTRELGIDIPCENRLCGPSSWSPCGKFIAVRTRDVVEIRDALTSELVSTLQLPPCRNAHPLSVPSYSPDGHSVACSHSNGIIIWDIQTGGVAKIFKSNSSPKRLVWSSDGGVVGVLHKTIKMYHIASGTEWPSITLKKEGGYIWAHNESFRVVTVDLHHNISIIEIFDVDTLTTIKSIPIQFVVDVFIWSFSPATYRISLFVIPSQLVILDTQTSGGLLEKNGHFVSHTFSSSGSHFGASQSDCIHIWTYATGYYIPWRQFSFPIGFEFNGFSPNSSSILVGLNRSLKIQRLESLPSATPTTTHIPQLDISSPSGTHIATASFQGGTVTITRLSQTSSQYIDTDLDIVGLGLTGNVLLVQGPGIIMAWLLTNDLYVHNVSGRAGRDDSIWTIPVSKRLHLKFSVEGETGVVKYGTSFHVYNSKTGEVLDPAQELPRFSGRWYSFDDNLQAQDDRCNGLPPAKYKWKRSDATWNWTDGWLKDPQGQCLLWLPIEWRSDWRGNVEWFPDISTIKFKSRDSKPIIIKLN